MELSERLQQLMDERDWDAAKLSRESGLPYTTLDSILKGGSRSPTIGNVHKLALAFDLSVEELLGLDFPAGVFRLDEDTGAMLNAYRKLSPERRKVHWKAIMRALANEPCA